MKIDELELYKSLKVLTESGYIVSDGILTENRTFDVEELVVKYKDRIMKLLRQKLYSMLDKVFDDKPVEKVITIAIPPLMVPVSYRKEPVKMKSLIVKIYCDSEDVAKDYDVKYGKSGYGPTYAMSAGDTNPDFTPVPMMLNLPYIIASSSKTVKTAPQKKKLKSQKKITEGKYTSRKSNIIQFPKTATTDSKSTKTGNNRDNIIQLNKTADKSSTQSANAGTNFRTAERDALYDRFRQKYGGNGYYGNTKSSYSIWDNYFDDDGDFYGGYSYNPYHDAFDFKEAVECLEQTLETPDEIIDQLMDEYFGDFFQEVLHHELTHYIQANNKELDGTENAKDYDPKEVLASGKYWHDELEYEAKLHQKLPEYINAIQKARDITPIAKKIVNQLFNNKFNTMEKDKQRKFFNEILALCQTLKSHPEITRYNFNSARVKKLLYK